MKTSLWNFVLAAVAGLSVLTLAQTPVHAQARVVTPRVVTPRVVTPRVVPVTPVAPVFPPTVRTPIVVPPVRSFTNPYVLPGLTLNQLGTLSVLSMDPMLMSSINSYYNMYRPIYITPTYPTVPYATTFGTPAIPGNPYAFYNPYFAAFGLYP
ncbi:MAG TPA: hypothetical protein VH682_12250 [Gemmataceae bacterium]